MEQNILPVQCNNIVLFIEIEPQKTNSHVIQNNNQKFLMDTNMIYVAIYTFIIRKIIRNQIVYKIRK